MLKATLIIVLLVIVPFRSISTDCPKHIKRLLEQSERLWEKGKSEDAILVLQPVVDSVTSREHFDLRILARLYESIGKYYWRSGNPDYRQALETLTKCLEIRKNVYKDANLEIASAHFYLGSLYRYGLNDVHNAELNFKQSLAIRQQLGADTSDLVKTYYNLATTYRVKGDMEHALPYGLNALRLCRKINDPDLLARTYGMVANIYFDKTDFEIAKQQYGLSINILDSLYGENSLRHVGVLNNLGNANMELLEYRQAQDNFRDALFINRKLQPGGWNESTSYLNLGFYHSIQNQFDSALNNYHKCLKIRQKIAAEEPSHFTVVFQRLGDLYHSQQVHDSALFYYQNALISSVPGFNSPEIENNPNLSQIARQTTVFNILAKKAATLSEKASSSPNFHNNFHNNVKLTAFATFHLADKLLSENRRSFKQEGSQLILTNHASGMYENAVELAFKAYTKTKEVANIEEALFFMEKNKASILVESIILLEQNKSFLSEELIREKNRIESEMLLLRAERTQHKPLQDAGISSRFVSLFNSQDSLVEVIRRTYPEYYSIKYDSFLYDLNTIKSYSRKQKLAIAEYFTGERNTYVITIQGQVVNFHKIGKTTELATMVAQVIQGNKRSPRFGQTQVDYDEFKRCALATYRKILGETAELSKMKSLLIVPDGLLSHMPFESLVTRESADDKLDYGGLNYLIKEIEIGYTYSLRFQFNLLSRESHPTLSGVFAMGYSDVESNSNLVEIPFTAHEVKEISKVIQTKYYLGSDASKERYSIEASKYSILHLGAHGFIDEANPLNSGLRFQGTQEFKDDTIYLYEIYSQPIEAKLVVLAACETGSGTYYEGEGTYSLGRAFSYAGSNSVVQSLWKIDDHQSSKVVEYFYRNLSRGQTVSQALQKSKISYLSQASELSAHPAYWAGLIPVGVNQEIIPPLTFNKYKGIFAIIVVILGLFGYLYKRRLQSGR